MLQHKNISIYLIVNKTVVTINILTYLQQKTILRRMVERLMSHEFACLITRRYLNYYKSNLTNAVAVVATEIEKNTDA
jgi:hypothetical protein